MRCEDCGADLGIGEDTTDAGDLLSCDCGARYVWIDALVPEAPDDEQDRDTVPDGES